MREGGGPGRGAPDDRSRRPATADLPSRLFLCLWLLLALVAGGELGGAGGVAIGALVGLLSGVALIWLVEGGDSG